VGELALAELSSDSLPHLKNANVADGAALFALNCASCHTIEGDGDALALGTFSPSLRRSPRSRSPRRFAPARQYAAIHGNLSDAQVNDIVKYVTTEIQHRTTLVASVWVVSDQSLKVSSD